METIKHVINDQANWWTPVAPDEASVIDLMDSRGIRYTDLTGWHNLDQHELALGETQGRVRIKLVPREEMVAVSRGE